ncbi:biotin/lipoyl-containing protein [Comamonas sp. A7-5]|uniref:acetyl-CoA carboxylase biotin carboxyl carrier protein subunit n=1 Tax=Comamonas sp. A7-5 TaxID=673549 RepID=UPI0031E401F7
MTHALRFQNRLHDVWLSRPAQRSYVLHLGEQALQVDLVDGALHPTLHFQGQSLPVHIAVRGDDVHVHLEGEAHTLSYAHLLDRLASQTQGQSGAVSRAPMPGSVIQVLVEPGQAVQRGDTLLVMESMKMESAISAEIDGVVHEVHVQKGQTFERDALLVTLEPSETQT